MLSAHARQGGAVRGRIEGEEEAILIPAAALRPLVEILGQTADGNAATPIPSHAELTTQEAADLLNVSRPYLIGLLERNAIPHRRVGTHRRVAVADILAYKRREDEAHHRALDELAAQSQVLGMGY